MVNSVYQIFVEQITVLILLHACVEQTGSILKTKLTDLIHYFLKLRISSRFFLYRLLYEVKVFVFIIIILLQIDDEVRLVNNNYEVQTEVPRKSSLGGSLQLVSTVNDSPARSFGRTPSQTVLDLVSGLSICLPPV